MLKRTSVNLSDCYRDWVESIDKQRVSLQNLFKDSPSLKLYFVEVFDEIDEDSLKIVSRSYPQCNFPEQ